MSPTHYAPIIPDYTITTSSTDGRPDSNYRPNDGKYGQVNPHLQWQRQPADWNQGVQNQGVQYVTKTVSGFMDFVTTVGNTVMVFLSLIHI